MSKDDSIAIALRQPAGAEFRKCALQVNPSHYSGTYRGQPSAASEAEYAQAMIDKAKELGITVLAVTDHNHVGGIAAIRAAARERAIHVFPGFELASTEGIHVLCLYPPDFTEERLDRCLGECGVRSTTMSSEVCDKSFSDLLACVRNQGGISIAAHVTNNKGLFKALQGQARIRAWKDDSLCAIQIPGSVQGLPEDIRKIVENRNPDYRRQNAPESNLAVAVVNAADVKSPEDLSEPSASCWVKMSEVGIEGLRQAFLDPGSRIRLHTDPSIDEHAELVAMAWQGGFLDNTAVRFNPNLNVLDRWPGRGQVDGDREPSTRARDAAARRGRTGDSRASSATCSEAVPRCPFSCVVIGRVLGTTGSSARYPIPPSCATSRRAKC